MKSGITGLASALKVGSEHVYEVLTKQQLVKSITWLLIGVIPLIILLVFGKKCYRWGIKNADESDSFTLWMVFFFFASTLLPSIFLMFHFDELVTGFVNPEYGALKDIMDFIK